MAIAARARPGRDRGRRAGARARRCGGRSAGTLGHIGVFSLNYHKTIHCGEGGVAVTDDDAARRAPARSRATTARPSSATWAPTHADILGFNYRMGELEAAIAEVQLARLDELTEPRIAHADAARRRRSRSSRASRRRSCPTDARHVYYLHVDPAGRGRRSASRATRSPPRCGPRACRSTEGYVAPLYRQPLYRAARAPAFGDPRNAGLGRYEDGQCPTCERMQRARGAAAPAGARRAGRRATSTT